MFDCVIDIVFIEIILTVMRMAHNMDTVFYLEEYTHLNLHDSYAFQFQTLRSACVIKYVLLS